jgi:leader peptidase (prepilin peptidase)/N-methyltransferase
VLRPGWLRPGWKTIETVCTRHCRVHFFVCLPSRSVHDRGALHNTACVGNGGRTRVVKVASIVVAGAIAVAASIVVVPGIAGWLGAGLALVMLAIAAIDARRFIIPDPLNAAGLVLGFLHATALGEGGLASALGEAAARGCALALMFLILRWLYLRLRGREGIGLGDVKLAAVAGAWLGWIAMPIAIEIAALSAIAVYATRHFILGRPVHATTRLPFGLFFAPAIWLGWLLQATVLQIY